MNYNESMEYMNSVNQYGSVLGLENTKELLKRLGNPQGKLRFVHVAGTNGKGSVCTYITRILVDAGYCVGRYISPTIFEYRERIQVISKTSSANSICNTEMTTSTNSAYISEEQVAKHLTLIKDTIETMTAENLPHPTPFEIETAMAFLEFVEAGCDIVVLEVGMGGRLDSTNVITSVDCAVLASISMDHMGFLGNTLEEIAAEKAGIIKNHFKVVSYDQNESVRNVIQEKCTLENAMVRFADFSQITDINYDLTGTKFCYENNRIKKLFLADMLENESKNSTSSPKLHLHTPLLGENQPKNAAVAVEVALCLKESGYHISIENIINGIHSARWKGRLDIVNQNPLVFVDGAHNYDAALSLKKSMDIYFKDKKVIAVIGMFADKEYDKVLSVTLDKAEKVFTLKPNNPRGLASETMAEYASKYCNHVIDAKTAINALELALKEADNDSIVLCFGSLSFLHEIYAYFV